MSTGELALASALTGQIADLANELFRGPDLSGGFAEGAPAAPAGGAPPAEPFHGGAASAPTAPAPAEPSPVMFAVPEGLATSLVDVPVPAPSAAPAPRGEVPGPSAQSGPSPIAPPESPSAPAADAPYFLALAGLPATSVAPAASTGWPSSMDALSGFPSIGPGMLPAAAASWGDPSGGALPAPSLEGVEPVATGVPSAQPVSMRETTTSPAPSAPAEPSPITAVGPSPMGPQAAPNPGPLRGPYEFQPELAPHTSPAGGAAQPVAGSGPGLFDPHAVKRDFPILRERVRGRPLVWLDNAATTQKPQAVIDRISYFYEHENSNVHRAAHTLAARATDAYEGAREKVRRFLNAPSTREIVFVRGATEGINLIAQSWGRRNVGPGDEIVISWLEHHANIVPWQMLCAEKGARLKVAPVDARGDVILEEYEKLLGPRTRLVSFTQVSNALGTVVPAREMIEMAHRHGARVVLDGAQAVSHMPVDVQLLGCDFYVFSGHKVFAPTGIGVVFGKSDVLEAMPPWQGGGNMIADVTFERTLYQPAPGKFEAGTGNIADAVGLGAALDYLGSLGLANVSRHEHDLRLHAERCLTKIPGLRIIGEAREKAGVVSFVLEGIRTEEVGGALDQEGIAVRSGHHCAQPILRRFGVEATVRASLAPYNTREDVDALVAAVRRLVAGTPAAMAE